MAGRWISTYVSSPHHLPTISYRSDRRFATSASRSLTTCSSLRPFEGRDEPWSSTSPPVRGVGHGEAGRRRRLLAAPLRRNRRCPSRRPHRRERQLGGAAAVVGGISPARLGHVELCSAPAPLRSLPPVLVASAQVVAHPPPCSGSGDAATSTSHPLRYVVYANRSRTTRCPARPRARPNSSARTRRSHYVRAFASLPEAPGLAQQFRTPRQPRVQRLRPRPRRSRASDHHLAVVAADELTCTPRLRRPGEKATLFISTPDLPRAQAHRGHRSAGASTSMRAVSPVSASRPMSPLLHLVAKNRERMRFSRNRRSSSTHSGRGALVVADYAMPLPLVIHRR